MGNHAYNDMMIMYFGFKVNDKLRNWDFDTECCCMLMLYHFVIQFNKRALNK